MKRIRDAFPSAALLAVGVVAALGLAELGVRVLERFEVLGGPSGSEIFEGGPFQGTFRLSRNPRLLFEPDPGPRPSTPTDSGIATSPSSGEPRRASSRSAIR